MLLSALQSGEAFVHGMLVTSGGFPLGAVQKKGCICFLISLSLERNQFSFPKVFQELKYHEVSRNNCEIRDRQAPLQITSGGRESRLVLISVTIFQVHHVTYLVQRLLTLIVMRE